MVGRVIDGMLTVLVWLIVLVPMVELCMSLVIARIFVKAIVVLLFIVVRV